MTLRLQNPEQHDIAGWARRAHDLDAEVGRLQQFEQNDAAMQSRLTDVLEDRALLREALAAALELLKSIHGFGSVVNCYSQSRELKAMIDAISAALGERGARE